MINAVMPTQYDKVYWWEIKREIHKQLSVLSPRQEFVIEMYYGLNGDEEKTLAEIGAMIGVCREVVRGIRERGLRMLRHPNRGCKLKELYYD